MGLRFATLLFALGVGLNAFADSQLQDLRLWRRANTLVSGQQVWSFQSSYQNISNHYGASGSSEALGRGLTRRVSWRQLASADAGARNFVRANNIRENDVAASASYDIDREEIGFGLNWAYGLTKRWMVGFEVPTVLTTTRVTQNVSAPAGQENMVARARAVANAQLAQAGYAEVPARKSNFALRNVSLLSRVALADNYDWTWSIQQLLRVPTAQNPSMSDYVADSRNEGPVNLGFSSLLDFRWRRFILGARGGYTYQLPDQVRTHVGGDAIDTQVDRQLGSYVSLGGDAEYRATEHLSLSLGYSFLSKAGDVYAQGHATDFDYSQLGAETDQVLHQSRLGFFYTIDGRHDGRIGTSDRWLLGLDYLYPWIGRNAVDAARASLEVTNYF